MFLRCFLLSSLLPALCLTLSCSWNQEEPHSAAQTDSVRKLPLWRTPDSLPEKPLGRLICGETVLPLSDYLPVRGFAQPEEWGVWTDADTAELDIAMPHPLLNRKVTVQFPAAMFIIYGKQQKYTVQVNCGKVRLLQQEIAMPLPENLHFDIPAELNRTPRLRLTFQFSGIHRITELGGQDERKLGIGLRYTETEKRTSQVCVTAVVEKISDPDNQANQLAEIRVLERLSGSDPLFRVKTEISALAADPAMPRQQFRTGDVLLLTMQKTENGWQVLYGGYAPGSFTAENELPVNADAANYTSPFGAPYNPALPEKAVEEQRRILAEDFKQLRQQLKTLNRDLALDERILRSWLQQQKKYQILPKFISPESGQEIERFQNRFVWGENADGVPFALPPKFEYLRSGNIAPNITAMAALHSLFRRHNIQLIVMLQPDGQQTAARALVPEAAPFGDKLSLQCAAMLLEYGIETIYAGDALFYNPKSRNPLFCYPDAALPAQGLWDTLADLAAARLQRFEQSFVIQPAPRFGQRRVPTVFGKNYCWPEGIRLNEYRSGEVVETDEILMNGKPFRPDPASRILVIGNHTLDYPGPGHSFAATLSRQLNYPVDQLTLRGNALVQSLPQTLLENPSRWLKGKQICLLVIPPEMLSGCLLPDIRALDAEYRRTAGRKRLCTLDFSGSAELTYLRDIAPTDILCTEKHRWNRLWNFKLRTAGKLAGTVRIKESGKVQPFHRYTLPKNRSGKPVAAVIEVAVYPEQTSRIILNGEEFPLFAESEPARFRPVMLELPADAEFLDIQFSGEADNIIAVRSVNLYQ